MVKIYKINDNCRALLVKFMRLSADKSLTWNNYIYGNNAGITCKNGKIEIKIGYDYPEITIDDLLNIIK